MGQATTILAAEDVYREFVTPERLLPVLKGICLRVNRGEMVAVSGASGVGKSTLLHILGGLDRPTKGTVTLQGTPMQEQSEDSLARFRNKSVGFVFQSHYLLDDFDALENVMIPMLLAGTARSEAAARAEHLLQEVSLADRQTHRPRQLSGGEQQRVAVARALANRPEIVLADEPSGNLDTATGRSLHELLFRLNSETSATFVIATHNEELAGGCSRRCRLQDGRLNEE